MCKIINNLADKISMYASIDCQTVFTQDYSD